MNNKALSLASLLLLSSPVVAMEDVTQDDKSGHAVHVGISKISGDISNFLDDNAVFSFGYDYTTKNGVIIGGYYMPDFLSVSASRVGAAASIESSVLGLYSGYQLDNNFRFVAGLSFTYSEATLATSFVSASDDETNIGIVFGADYLVNEKFLIGARISTHEVGNVDGTTFGINAGYKF